MRVLPSFLLAALLLVTTPASAARAQSPFWSQSEVTTLDQLYDSLKAAPDEASARTTADAIWAIWTQPDNEAAAAHVAEIIEKSGLAGPASQMPLIEALVADFPDYPEAWNLRATARFFRGDTAGALADIAETLKREPSHFGALAGRALILHELGRSEDALAAIKAGLAVHPFLPERALFPDLAP